jgi:hypothetical protein
VFRRALHWSLFWTRSIQSIPPHSLSLRSILILSSRLHQSLPSVVFFLLDFPPKSYMHSSPHACYMPCPSHPSWLDHSSLQEMHKIMHIYNMKIWARENIKFTMKRIFDMKIN